MDQNKFKVKVLDHGWIQLCNIGGPIRRISKVFDGQDEDPAICARNSFDNMDEVRTYEQDMKLNEYLMAHWHTSPFEMIEVWLRIKMPFFVFRQFERHRTAIKSTASLNEISGRYVQLPTEWYIPSVVGGKAKNKKQGQEDNLSIELQQKFKEDLNKECEESYSKYVNYLEAGVAPEHARLFLHVNHYTEVVWKQDLHNLMHFLALRTDSHAQIEARQYANTLYELLKYSLPGCMTLFDKYRKI